MGKMLKFYKLGDEYIIEKEKEKLYFYSPEEVVSCIQDLDKGKAVKLGKFEVYNAGKTLDYNKFMLKIHNKGEYDRRYKSDDKWENENSYDDFISLETIRKSGINYIKASGESMDFEESYKRAYKLSLTMLALFGRKIDVFIFKNQSYTLQSKYFESINRHFKSNEYETLNKKYSNDIKKGTRQGAQKSKTMQQAILAKMGN